VLLVVLSAFGCTSRKTTAPATSTAPASGPTSGGGGGGADIAAVSSMRLDLRTKSLANLRNLGIAYQTALASGGRPPRGPDELKAYLEGGDRFFKSPYNDNRPYEFAWGLDPARLQGSSATTLLAWEQSPDDVGGRCVLLANMNAQYVTAADFAQMHKPPGR
jgi:hypothetical protein